MAKFISNKMKIEIGGVDVSAWVDKVTLVADVNDAAHVILSMYADDDFIKINGHGLRSILGPN